MVSRQILLFALIVSLQANFAIESKDRCSRFEGYYHDQPLSECPQAKFMVKDDLFECYDKFYKENETSKCKIYRYIHYIFFFADVHNTISGFGSGTLCKASYQLPILWNESIKLIVSFSILKFAGNFENALLWWKK